MLFLGFLVRAPFESSKKSSSFKVPIRAIFRAFRVPRRAPVRVPSNATFRVPRRAIVRVSIRAMFRVPRRVPFGVPSTATFRVPRRAPFFRVPRRAPLLGSKKSSLFRVPCKSSF